MAQKREEKLHSACNTVKYNTGRLGLIEKLVTDSHRDWTSYFQRCSEQGRSYSWFIFISFNVGHLLCAGHRWYEGNVKDKCFPSWSLYSLWGKRWPKQQRLYSKSCVVRTLKMTQQRKGIESVCLGGCRGKGTLNKQVKGSLLSSWHFRMVVNEDHFEILVI